MPDTSSLLHAHSIQTEKKPSQLLSDKTDQSTAQLVDVQQQKASLNVSILESAAVIIGVKDAPLSLLLNSTVEQINDCLVSELGENAVQKAIESESDVSPEATAERIVGQFSRFYDAFRMQHPEQDESTVLNNFIEIISSSIERGFSEARDILEGLEVLEGDIARDIDQTLALIREKLAAFEAMITDSSTDPEVQLDRMF